MRAESWQRSPGQPDVTERNVVMRDAPVKRAETQGSRLCTPFYVGCFACLFLFSSVTTVRLGHGRPRHRDRARFAYANRFIQIEHVMNKYYINM